MNYVMWWLVCDGQLYIYVFVMHDCRTSNGYLSTLLACACFYLRWWMYFRWTCVASSFYFEFLAITFSFTRCVNITCHIASLLMDIYLLTHTCCTPWIAKFRGSFCLDVCKSCIDDSNWNWNSCIHQGGALHKFWVSKALNSFILIKA